MKPSGKVRKFHKYEKVIKVHCSKCHSFIKEDDTEFVNIEEDMQGADILTFICPDCKTQQKSKRFG
jgi:RNase P subunit RPR2